MGASDDQIETDVRGRPGNDSEETISELSQLPEKSLPSSSAGSAAPFPRDSPHSEARHSRGRRRRTQTLGISDSQIAANATSRLAKSHQQIISELPNSRRNHSHRVALAQLHRSPEILAILKPTTAEAGGAARKSWGQTFRDRDF